jgi:hypothetical protein
MVVLAVVTLCVFGLVFVMWLHTPRQGSQTSGSNGTPGHGKGAMLDAGLATASTPVRKPDTRRLPAEPRISARPDGGTDAGDAGTKMVRLPTPSVSPTLLSVASRPRGCRVQLDGLEVPGLTPIDDLGVEPNTDHKVTVLCKQHRPQTKKISGRPGQRVALSFKPQPKKTPQKIKNGTLRLKTSPWSIVFLGKRKLGMTPLVGVKLPAGKHKLTAVNAERGIRENFYVTIRPGKTTMIQKKLGK